MKHLIASILLLVTLSVTAQQFKEVNALALLGSGIAVELANSPEYPFKPLGYAFGSAFEFGSKTSKGIDFSIYARGEMLFLTKYTTVSALIGLRDFYAVTWGMSVRGIIPTKKGPQILIEPMWRNDAQSRLVVGVRFKL